MTHKSSHISLDLKLNYVWQMGDSVIKIFIDLLTLHHHALYRMWIPCLNFDINLLSVRLPLLYTFLNS